MTRDLEWENWLSTLDKRTRTAVARTSRKTTAPAMWNVVVIPDAGGVTVTAYSVPELAAEAIGNLAGKDVTVMVFYGARIPLSKPPNRCLLLPGGKRLSVDGVPGAPEVDEVGYMGGPEPAFTPDVSAEEESSDEYEVEYDDVDEGVVAEEPNV